MLRLKSLGQTLIESNDVRVTPSAETVFATTLYLIVEAGRPVGRDELTRMIWPSVSESRAQHGLRQVLYKLKTLGATIKADRSSLILSPRFCSTDFADLLEPQPNSVLEALATNIGGSFLPGYRPELSEQFAAWVERQRDTVHSAVARALVAGMQARKRVSDWTGAEQFASMCLSIDPLNEEATLTVAEAAALGGSKSKALSILNNYLKDIGEDASEIKLPAALLRRRISEAYQDNVFPIRDAPFVGREEEMAELTRALAAAQAGHGSAYVITGEPGIGKTRLVQEFTRVASLQRVHIVRVGCQSHDVRRPLSVFVDMVPKLLALPGALGCSPESMGYLRRLVAHDPDEARQRDDIEEVKINYSSSRQALLDILDAISTETCILAEIEDAQWIDPHSIRMIAELSQWLSVRSILVVATARTPILTCDTVTTIILRTLRKEDSAKVAAASANFTLGNKESFLEWCVASSGGNPFYLIELLRNGTGSHEEYHAPRSLTRLLQNRVLSLSPDARRLLEVCCVLGTHSNLERMEACVDTGRRSTLNALEELDQSGMIEGDGNWIGSRHDLLTSVVLENMSVSVNRMIHRFAAAHLEDEADSTKSVSFIWESAEHWQLAREAPRAIQLLRRCGSYLMDVGMPDEAARVLERAEALSESASEKLAICVDRARAFMRAELSLDAVVVIDRALRLRQSLGHETSPLDELNVMSLQARWENLDPISDLIQACLRAFSSELTTPDQRISAGGWLMTAADNLCDDQVAHQVFARLSADLLLDSVPAITRTWTEMVYHASFGDQLRALLLSRDLMALARKCGPPTSLVRYLRHAAHVERCVGTTDAALSLATEAFDISSVLKNRIAMAACATAVGSIYLQVGKIDLAELWLTRASDSHDPRDHRVQDLNLWSYKTELAIRQGLTELAEECMRCCVSHRTKTHSARSSARSYALETQVAILKGEVPSLALLESFQQVFTVSKTRSYQDFNAESLILGMEAVGKSTEAEIIAKEYVQYLRRDTIPLSDALQKIAERMPFSDPTIAGK